MKNAKQNLTMLMDLYELTMANGIFTSDMRDTVTYFDMFFRRVPDEGGFAIMAGLEQIIEYIEDLHFTESDIEYLRSKKIFSEEFLGYLRDFKFSGDTTNEIVAKAGIKTGTRGETLDTETLVRLSNIINTYIK